jgi:hypothetical protein
MGEREPRFEALVYTPQRELAAQCAAAFADFPVDWVMLSESSLALDYLSQDRFDYVILDVDSAENRSVLEGAVQSGVNLRSVVLAVTSSPVDPSLLDLCYESQVFYPVRPSEIQEQLNRTAPLAEQLADEQHPTPTVVLNPDAVLNHDSQEAIAQHSHAAQVLQMLSVGKHLRTKLTTFLRKALDRRHSLSIVAQERTASAIASIGAAWFVQEITVNYRGLKYLQPPSGGPTDLIFLAVLLWLCAKQRRVQERMGAQITV